MIRYDIRYKLKLKWQIKQEIKNWNVYAYPDKKQTIR